MSRPYGVASLAVLSVLQAGISGTYDQIASRAGLPPLDASVALRNLRRFGRVTVIDVAPSQGGQGRPPVVYGMAPAAPEPPQFDVLAFVRQHWR